MTQLLPPKKEVALALLERSNVDVYLDPRAKGVVVPPQFRKEPRLILKIGLNMPVPIPDLRLDDDSMSCTLSFNRSPFYCVVPWSSVFAMVGEDGRGMVWPDDVPQELAVKVVEPGEGPRSIGAGAQASHREGSQGPRAVEPAAAAAPSRRNGRTSKLAEDAPSSSSSPERASKAGAAGKRKKKKEEERPRPVLVAVPSAERREAGAESPREIRQAPEPRRPQPAPQRREETDGVSAVPSARPRAPMQPSQRRPPPSAPNDGPGRPKRELPPYLRIVK